MATYGQLGQIAAHATANNFVTVYTVPADTRVTGLILTICNVSGADSTYQVCQDDNGTTADATTALYWDVVILADTTVKLSIGPMGTATGTIQASAGTDTAPLTFTLHGTKQLI